MVPKCLAVLMAATSALARTPAGFTPSSEMDLIVEYNGFAPLNGVAVSRSVTTSEPRVGTLVRLNGTSYAVMMIDLDIPTENPPETSTLLHWMQTGLSPASTATQLNTTSGTFRVFLLENTSSTTPILAYFGPSPPARIPLSHRYTQILVDTSGISEKGTQALRAAAATIRGFDAAAVLEQAGLQGRVVAGNSYNVTNAGPALLAPNATTRSGTGTGGSTGRGGSAIATGIATGGGSENGAIQTAVPGASSELRPGSIVLGALAIVAATMLGL